ncbi:hypothetical protein BJV77DRAFT_1057109 [Russula vinacea]|nr:hypothetical protein BJV77DRAFT_1057109 [Russula vinacea]
MQRPTSWRTRFVYFLMKARSFYLANIRYNDINSSLTVRFRELRGLRNNRFTRFTQKLLIMRE